MVKNRIWLEIFIHNVLLRKFGTVDHSGNRHRLVLKIKDTASAVHTDLLIADIKNLITEICQLLSGNPVTLYKAHKVVCFDPHSHKMPEMIRNVEVRSSTPLIRQHIVGHADRGGPQRYQGIIAPDKGAIERATHVALATHLPLFRAEKHRNPDTGKLSGFSCEPLPDEGKFLVVDDICDGGGTFAGLAEATGLPKERLGLYVSHGVFSGYAYRLLDHFGEIWTTDSLDTCHNLDGVYHGQKINVIELNRTLKGYSS